MGNNNPFINVQPLFPLNGTEGQVLAKKTDVNFDTEWIGNIRISIGTSEPSDTNMLWIDTN